MIEEQTVNIEQSTVFTFRMNERDVKLILRALTESRWPDAIKLAGIINERIKKNRLLYLQNLIAQGVVTLDEALSLEKKK